MKIKDITQIGLFSAIIAVCSWISVPILAVPFTMQTFGVFSALLILGAKNGLISILIYIGLGMIGMPVFANFNSGFSAIFSATGGYIIGFIAQAIIYMYILKIFGEKIYIKIFALILGLIACYLFGSMWFSYIYIQNNNPMSFISILSACVFPYIIPDLLKMSLALTISQRISKSLQIKN